MPDSVMMNPMPALREHAGEPEFARERSAAGAAAADSARPLSGIVCIAIPFSALVWAAGYYLVHGLVR
jgi:hypothetical protein